MVTPDELFSRSLAAVPTDALDSIADALDDDGPDPDDCDSCWYVRYVLAAIVLRLRAEITSRTDHVAAAIDAIDTDIQGE